MPKVVGSRCKKKTAIDYMTLYYYIIMIIMVTAEIKLIFVNIEKVHYGGYMDYRPHQTVTAGTCGRFVSHEPGSSPNNANNAKFISCFLHVLNC